ncbi:MAG: single-stranded DNA-binding protein [Christensenellaceae bacterium]|nr:single-stranded DNA-binding protein [Christensenellaceae bacterium]
MNKVFLIGRLTNAPENRQTPNGVSVTTFSVAVNRRMNREVTDYFNIVAWRGLADTCARYLVKGQQVAVEGELQTRSYDGKDGVKRYVTEIVADNVEFLAKPNGAAGAAAAPFPAQEPMGKGRPSGADMFAQEMGDVLMEDEELPF